jgi:SAM-dependent methyltransferase
MGLAVPVLMVATIHAQGSKYSARIIISDAITIKAQSHAAWNEHKLKSKLIDYLVCPQCKGRLNCSVYREETGFSWQEIMEGCLTCRDCDREYPIERGIPRIVANPLSAAVKNTVEGFGFEWQSFNKQIQDTYMTDKTHFLDFIHPITESHFEGKIVLDAGCGMGRFLKLGAEFGSREIIGIDLSQSVEAAYQNTRHLPNAHIIQANIFALPFNPIFDYVFSIGVLHHLDNPQMGFSHLVRALKENGSISIWVYSQENNGWVIALSPVRTHITSRLPKLVLLGVSHFTGIFLYLLLQLIYKPVNKARLGEKIKDWLPYNDYLSYSSQLGYLSLVSVVFDHLVPQLAAYISREELNGWFRRENFDSILITPRNRMSWRALGMRTTRS